MVFVLLIVNVWLAELPTEKGIWPHSPLTGKLVRLKTMREPGGNFLVEPLKASEVYLSSLLVRLG